MEALQAAAAAAAAAPGVAPAAHAAPSRRLSVEQRWSIIAYWKDNQPRSAIAAKLHTSLVSVGHWVEHYRAHGDVCDAPRSGRPRCTDEQTDTNIAASAYLQPFTSPHAIIREQGLDASRWTVDRRLQEAGLFGRVARHKREYSDAERNKRRSFADGYKGWAPVDWERVLFSDEKCFYSAGFCGRTWVRRPKGEALNPKYCVSKTAHPVKVNVWACFCAAGQGYTYIFNESLDAKLLKKIFVDGHLLESAADNGLMATGQQWYFLQDNAPMHKSREIQAWLHNNGVTCIDFPPYSPDLNPIENLWASLARAVERLPCESMEVLQDAVESAWKAIDPQLMRTLAHSMPARCQAVLDADGWHTKY
jgi:transposase